MRTVTVVTSLFFWILLCAGCGEHVRTLVGIDGGECVGEISAPPEGLVKMLDETLLDSALGRSGEGKLCAGKVFLATGSVKVYRVWDGAKPYTSRGSWWSFARPLGPRDAYQKANAICPEWSALDRVSVCDLKTEAEIVVGVGQSARCSNMVLEKSGNNQVFIPNNARENKIFVENCDDGASWP